MYSFAFYAAVGICSKHPGEDWFQNIHDGVMQYTIRKVRQSINYPFFWFVDVENIVSGCVIRFALEQILQYK